jgi:DNA repair exonuclease SbcCD ATPase subunit
MSSLEELAAVAAKAEREWQQALATAKGLEGRLAELGGDASAATVERLQRARDGLRAEAKQMGQRRTELETTLSILAGQDIHEREQEAAARLAAAEVGQERVRRRAAASRKLADTLEACRTAIQTRMLAPAVAAVGRHLQPLFPSTAVALGEDLSVVGLQTRSHPEALLDLSGGTREQVGLAVRLGLAGLLAAGERLPMVLDDALTNTDFRRIEQLHQVLYAAAEQLQIVLFSCHPEAFAGLGAARRYRLPARTPR